MAAGFGAQSPSENGVTFVCIHGLGSSHAFYATLASKIADSGNSCVLYDTYGSFIP